MGYKVVLSAVGLVVALSAATPRAYGGATILSSQYRLMADSRGGFRLDGGPLDDESEGTLSESVSDSVFTDVTKRSADYPYVEFDRIVAGTTLDASLTPDGLTASGVYTAEYFYVGHPNSLRSPEANTTLYVTYTFEIDTPHEFTMSRRRDGGGEWELYNLLYDTETPTEYIAGVIDTHSPQYYGEWVDGGKLGGTLQPGTYTYYISENVDAQVPTIPGTGSSYAYEFTLTESPAVVPLPPTVWAGGVALLGAMGLAAKKSFTMTLRG